MNEPFHECGRELTVCPKCVGRGYIEDMWDYHGDDVERDECPFCNGTGRAWKITTTTYEPF